MTLSPVRSVGSVPVADPVLGSTVRVPAGAGTPQTPGVPGKVVRWLRRKSAEWVRSVDRDALTVDTACGHRCGQRRCKPTGTSRMGDRRCRVDLRTTSAGCAGGAVGGGCGD